MPFMKVISVYFGNHMKHASTMCNINSVSLAALYKVAHQLPLVFKQLKIPSPSIHKHTIQKPMKGYV